MSDEEMLTPSPPSLSEAQTWADVSLLAFALERGWGGLGKVEQGVYEQALSALEGPGKTDTPHDLCRHVARSLSILPDAHFRVTLSGGEPCTTAHKVRGSVGENIASKSEAPWKSMDVEQDSKRLRVLDIRRFLPPGHPGWHGLIDVFDGPHDEPDARAS